MKNRKMKFGELKVFDIFETGAGDYYIKIQSHNGFNSILLTGKDIECHLFDDNTEIIKF